MLSQRQGWGQGMGVGVMQDVLFPLPKSPVMLTWEKYLTSSPHALYSHGNYVVQVTVIFKLTIAVVSSALPGIHFASLPNHSAD